MNAKVARIGRKLRRLREKRGWTQTQVADQVGVRVASVSRWEADRDQPRMEYVARLAQIFDTPMEELMTADPPPDLVGVIDEPWRVDLVNHFTLATRGLNAEVASAHVPRLKEWLTLWVNDVRTAQTQRRRDSRSA